MRTPILVSALLIGGLAASAAHTAAPPVTAWINGRWFDGTAFKRLEVYSAGDRLTLNRPRKIDRTVDLSGRFITLPFGEARNHNLQGSAGDAAVIRTYLEQGIFYVMIQGAVPAARTALSGRINRPESVDVAFAGGGFTAPGGHPSALIARNIKSGGMQAADGDGGFYNVVASAEDVDRAWTRVEAQRPDFIKIFLVYSEDRVAGLSRPTNSDRHGIDPKLVFPIVEKVHRDKLRAFVHVESAFDFDIAISARADVIAHLPGFWPDARRIADHGVKIYRISDQAAEGAGKRHVTVITTLGEALGALESGKEWAGLRDSLLEVYRHNLSTLARHRVRVAIGSDQFRGTSLGEALAIHKAGLMTSVELLRALSIETPTVIFPDRAPIGFGEGARSLTSPPSNGSACV